jgi:signal transduction histidine kinase
MKDFLDFDKNFHQHTRILYIVFSFLGILGNVLDLIFNFHSWFYILNIYNLIVITIIASCLVLFLNNKIGIKGAIKITLYTLLANIIISNYTTIFNDPNNSLYLLREALFTCFLITAAYLLLNEVHGLATGLIFISYFILATTISKNEFLNENLPGILILYLSYLLILNYFYRYLNFNIRKINEDRDIIKKQNEELKLINNELKESQRHINAQHEELIALTESISDQNKMLAEQNNKLEESVQQKAKIFSIIAHDIKSPLYSMTSLAELMYEKFDEVKDERKKLFLSKIISSNHLLQNLIENLLTWTRSQTGMIEMNPEHINLRETIEKILSLYKNYASEKFLQIQRGIDDQIIINVDRMMIETVLRNLISNAIKYSYDHGIIDVSAEKQGLYYKVSVKDQGTGIDKSRIQSIFSSSDGIITSGTKGEKGTGLGLRICKEFIDKMQGKLWIESELNKGTTISFILPFNNKPVQ